MSNKYTQWANKHAGKPAKQVKTVAAPPPASVAPIPQLPPPPPGMQYVMYNGQLVVAPVVFTNVNTSTDVQNPALVPPPRQPQAATPYVPQPHYQQVTAPGQVPAVSVPAKTNLLVKPGDRDTYAELLASVPDLVPPGAAAAGPDGRPSAVSAQELGNLSEFQSAVHNDQNAYPRGAPTGRVAELGSVSVPIPQAEPVPVPPPAAIVSPAPLPPMEQPVSEVSTRPIARR